MVNYCNYEMSIKGKKSELLEERCEPFFTADKLAIYTEYDDEGQEIYESRCDEVYNFTLC